MSRARPFIASLVLGLAALALSACAERVSQPPKPPMLPTATCPEPSDAEWPNKYWGLKKISACQAWARVPDASSAKIAVLDSGIADHPDLPGREWPLNGNRCVTGTANQTDEDGHGTKVAGIIGGKRSGTYAVGVAWSARLRSYKFLCPSGFTVDRAMDAMRFALAASPLPDVVNASWTQFPQSPGDDTALAELNTLVTGHANVLFVFAAPPGTGPYPAFAGQSNVLVVTSSTSDDTIPRWAGHDKSWVHLAAPGAGIATSDSLTGAPGTTTFQGASAAAAFVSGCAALVKIASSNPLSGAQIAALLTSTVDKPSGVTGAVKFGRLNCGAAVSAVP